MRFHPVSRIGRKQYDVEVVEEFWAWFCPADKFHGAYVIVATGEERHEVKRALEAKGHKPVYGKIQLMRLELSDVVNSKPDNQQQPKPTGRREHERKKSA